MKLSVLIAGCFVLWSAAAHAGQNTFGTVIPTQIIYPIFNGNAAHITSNRKGTILAYQVSTKGSAYRAQEERVVWYKRDPLSTRPVTIFDRVAPTNVPCVAATSTGEFWAGYGDLLTNTATVLRWTDPTTQPQTFVIPSAQGQNAKFTCLYDEMRRDFYFVGSGFHLGTIDDSGKLITDLPLLSSSSSKFLPQYPNLHIGDDGDIDLAWTTVDRHKLRESAVPRHLLHAVSEWRTELEHPWYLRKALV